MYHLKFAPLKSIFRQFLVLFLLIIGFIGSSFFHPSQVHATSEDWPTFLHDAQRSSASNDTVLSASLSAQLKVLWTQKTGGGIAASPSIVNGTVYLGSWDGYEYALDANTGAIKWKTFLGITTAPNCEPPQLGISSAADVENGTVYVGGGDSYWYALDAATGNVQWKVFTGDNSAVSGHYNWASPLIYNGYAYIGVSSLGDCPLVQGQLLKVDLNTHQVVNTVNFVPYGQVGGGIWTTPLLDRATNTIYVTTGTINKPTQIYSQAIVALDADSLAILSSWQVPTADTVIDSDFGNSPLLFTNSANKKLIGAVNKNGYFYTWDASNLGIGPLWRKIISVGGQCPTCGQGSVSSGAFANGAIYMAGGNTSIQNVGFQGGVRKISPDDGTFFWEHGSPGPVIPAIAYDNGMVIDGAGNYLEVLDSSTGKRLYNYNLGSPLYAAPSIANGIIYTGNVGGTIYAFALPTTAAQPPADPNCPSGWNCQDIGLDPTATDSAGISGTEQVAGSNWTLQSAAAGIGSTTTDSFRFIAQPTNGDTQVSTQVTTSSASATVQAGVMIRQNTNPDSPFYSLLINGNNQLSVMYRDKNKSVPIAITSNLSMLPTYLSIERHGDSFQAATSADGITYTLIPGTTVNVVMPDLVQTGIFSSAAASNTLTSASFNQVSISSNLAIFTSLPTASACPASWTCASIGNPLTIGDQNLNNGSWTISGAGKDIDNYADQFHLISQPFTSDISITAHLTNQTVPSPNAKTGLMIRTSLDPAAAYYSLLFSPGSGLTVQYRSTNGLETDSITPSAIALPTYLRIDRSGAIFSAYTSTDGNTWTYIPTSGMNLPNITGPAQVGIAVTGANQTQLSTTTYDTVQYNTTVPPAPIICPTGWDCQDIGFPGTKGSQSLEALSGTWTVAAAGSDIYGASDEFRYVWQTLNDDGALSARVLSQTNTDNWAKAGVMLRQTADATSPYYGAFITPGNGVTLQYRVAANQNTSTVKLPSLTTPIYLKAGRTGNSFSAYTSADGVTWVLVPGSTVNLTNINGPILAGLAATSHHTSSLSTVVFDNLNFTHIPPPPPITCPIGWSCQDIGAPLASGSATQTNGTFTVSGSGADIWGGVNQFQFMNQTLTGDGQITARLTSQTNTSSWAKAGVMIKQSTTATDPYVAAIITPSNGMHLQWNGSGDITGTTPTLPNAWIRISRSGNTFSSYQSNDGVNWNLVGSTSVPMNSQVLVGLFATAHNDGVLSAAAFDNVSISHTVLQPLPAAWSDTDIGGPSIHGSASYLNGQFTINGGGSDIWGNVDQFHYVYQPLTGDGAIVARVTSQANTSSWAKAGVMIKQSTTTGDPYTMVLVSPSNGIHMQSLFNTDVNGGPYNFPVWLKVARAGNTFTSYSSVDGLNWTLIGSKTIQMSPTATIGLFTTSHNGGSLGSATFDHVSIMPSAWSDTDIGTPNMTGTTSYNNGTFSVTGSGADIWGNADQLHFTYQPLSGDGTIIARVTGQTNTSSWAKAGIMIKQSTTAGSAYSSIFASPSNGIHMQSMFNTDVNGGTYTFPVWLKLVRSGNSFSTYTSVDGSNWNFVGTKTIAMTPNTLFGLFTTSHNVNSASVATFDNVSVLPAVTNALPSGWQDADLGDVGASGNATYANNTFNVSGSGYDIWGNHDDFHYVYKNVTGDATISARVTSQTNTSSYAKAGVMIKQSTAFLDPYFMVGATPGIGFTSQWNFPYNAVHGSSFTFPNAWVSVSRVGDVFTSYTSTDGVTWLPVTQQTIPMNANVTIGLFVTSHNHGTLSTATFDNVTGP